MTDSRTQKASRALVVDDVEFNLTILITMLGDKGWETVPAQSGEQALAILAQDTDFDLILMDISLPGIDGVATSKKIKKNETTSSIPVIALTAETDSATRDKFLAEGMDGYLAKNFDPDQFWHELESIRRNGKSAPKATGSISSSQPSPLNIGLLHNTFGNMKVIPTVASAFFTDTDTHLQELEKSLQQKDLEEVAKICHTLKGSATIFTAERLADVAAQLAKIARSNEENEFKRKLPTLIKTYNDLKEWAEQNL